MVEDGWKVGDIPLQRFFVPVQSQFENKTEFLKLTITYIILVNFIIQWVILAPTIRIKSLYCKANHSVRIDNSTFDRVEEFKYLGTTLTNQIYIAEENKSRLKSGNACYHSVQNILSSSLLSKNLKIKVYIEL